MTTMIATAAKPFAYAELAQANCLGRSAGIAMVEVLAAQAQLDKARADEVAAHYQLTVQRSALRLSVGKLDSDQL